MGAQRRPIDENDLPRVREEIVGYLQKLSEGAGFGEQQQGQMPMISEGSAEYVVKGSGLSDRLTIVKERIAGDGEYSLSGARYRQQAQVVRSKWETVELGDICSLMTGGTPKSTVNEYYENGAVPWLVSGDIHRMDIRDCEGRITEEGVANSNARYLPANSVLIALNGQGKTRGTVAMLRLERATCSQSLVSIYPLDKSSVCTEFVFWTLRSMYAEIRSLTGENERSGLNMTILRRIRIPLPPLEVQKEIVAEIEGYQKVIDGARAVVENYRPHIHIDPEWPMVELGDLCDTIQYGLSSRLNTENIGYKTFRMNELVEGVCVDQGNMKSADISAGDFEKYKLGRGDILFNRTNSFEHVGRTGIFDLDGNYCFASYLIRLILSKECAEPFYVNAFMNSKSFQIGIKQFATRAIGQSNINAKSLAAYAIPLPPLETQKAIVKEIEKEKSLVATNCELIERFENKIQDAVGRVWQDGKTV